MGERIKKLRVEAGLSQRALGEMLNASQQAVQKWEREYSSPSHENIVRMARIFGVSTDYLLGYEDGIFDYNADLPEYNDPWDLGRPSSPKAARIPVLGYIPAGVPLEAIENVLDWEEIPIEWTKNGKQYFGLKLRGDSMSPKYESGDIVIMLRTYMCDSGCDCAVIINGDDATFKRVFFHEEGGITLRPLNPLFPEMHYTAEQCENLPVKIIGVAKQIRREVM